MGFISAVFLGVASSLDNLGVGMAYGIRNVRVTFIANFIIGLLSGAAAGLTVLGGTFIKSLIGARVTALLGPALILAVGVWMLVDYAIRQKNGRGDDFDADFDKSGDISAAEAVTLGAVLAANCVATGFSAGIAGLSPIVTGVAAAAFSWLTVPLGIWLGRHCLAQKFRQKAGVAAGLLMFLIAVLEFIAPT